MAEPERRYLVPLTDQQVSALLRVDEGFANSLRKNSPLSKALDRIEEDCAAQRGSVAERCSHCEGVGWREPDG